MTQETTEKYKGLNNEELLMIYQKMKEAYDRLNENLEKKVIDRKIADGVFRKQSINDETVVKIKNSEKYLLVQNIVQKLEPVVELLTDMDENLKNLYNTLK